MKAIVYRTYGNPDVLELREANKPVPKADEVLLKVHAASVNSWDWDLLRGQPFLARIGAIRKPRYSILGADVAGVVEAVGANVRDYRPGDEVFGDLSGCSWGGFAEYACASERALSRKPAGLTFEEAAACPQAGVLALQAFGDLARIRPGQNILINGGGGGVGTFAIQMARSAGAEVTAVDRADKFDLMRSLGAGRVIDYMLQDFADSGESYDYMLDVSGTRSIGTIRRTLNERGTYVMIGGRMPRIFEAMLLGPLANRFGSKRIAVLLHKPNRADQDLLAALCEAGNMRPVIDRQYPLSETAEAIRYVGEGHAKGKVIIRMDV